MDIKYTALIERTSSGYIVAGMAVVQTMDEAELLVTDGLSPLPHQPIVLIDRRKFKREESHVIAWERMHK
jgi:hypothetical protein